MYPCADLCSLKNHRVRIPNFFLTLDQLLYGRMFRRTPFAESPFFHPDDILEVKNYFYIVDLEMQEKNTPIHPRLKSRGFLGKI